jgi:hypothetical protein
MAEQMVWMLIRQDAGGNRYRVGRYATRAEAERVAGALGASGEQVYVIERAQRSAGGAQSKAAAE